MQYCKKCTYPAVAVNLALSDDGICSGCKTNEELRSIDWLEREKEFKDLLLSYKSQSNYDCIIPVSGGKDSHYQAWYVKEKLGLNPLLVTYYTHNYTPTGERNLRNIGDALGLDHYIFRPSKKIISKMNIIGFEMTGDMSWHFHCGAWTVPFQLGVKLEIPLLIYGEHGFTDLAGQFSNYDYPEFTRRQRDEDMLRGYSIDDFVGKYGLERKDLLWTEYPTDEEIDRVGLRGIFMGNYVYWDANRHLSLAKEIGFEENPEPFERTYRRFSNVDDIHENGIKDYMKFIKFGYGRATDHTSKDIRHGHMSRDEGVEFVKKYDHVKAMKSLAHFLEMTGMTEEEFDMVADRFRDPRVWWIEDGLWWKDTLWGTPQAYGEVHLPVEKRAVYVR
jgi:N-acetyl sugar amidotransferase